MKPRAPAPWPFPLPPARADGSPGTCHTSWAAPRRTGRALVDDERVRAVYQVAIDEVNADLARHEQIKKFALLDRKLTVETGEVTPTMKLKRHVIEEKWSEVIAGLREEDGGE